jgi:hypothetical protein
MKTWEDHKQEMKKESRDEWVIAFTYSLLAVTAIYFLL